MPAGLGAHAGRNQPGRWWLRREGQVGQFLDQPLVWRAGSEVELLEGAERADGPPEWHLPQRWLHGKQFGQHPVHRSCAGSGLVQPCEAQGFLLACSRAMPRLPSYTDPPRPPTERPPPTRPRQVRQAATTGAPLALGCCARGLHRDALITSPDLHRWRRHLHRGPCGAVPPQLRNRPHHLHLLASWPLAACSPSSTSISTLVSTWPPAPSPAFGGHSGR